MSAATEVSAAPALHPYVQRLIDTAPPLDGDRRAELAALLLQARATRNNSEAGPCPGPAVAIAEPAAHVSTSAAASCAG